MIELGGKGNSQKQKLQVFKSASNLGINDANIPWPLDWNRETRMLGRPGISTLSIPSVPQQPKHSLWGHLWESVRPHHQPIVQQSKWTLGFQALLSDADGAAASGHYDEAEVNYNKAIELTKCEDDSYTCMLSRVQATCALASLLAHRERGEEAEKILIDEVNAIEAISEQSPALASLYHHLGMLYRNLGQPIEAVRMFDQTLALLPPDKAHEQRASAFMGRGISSSDIQDHAIAAHSFVMVNRELDLVSLSPSTRKLEAKICATAALILNNDCITAEAVCREAIELWDIIGGKGIRSAGLWNMLGFAHARNNNLSEAIRAYRTSLQVINDSSLNCPDELADAHFNLAILLAATQRLDDADMHLRRAAEVVDGVSRKMQSRETHFRRVFMQFFQSDKVSIGTRDLAEALLFSQPT